MTDHSSGRRRSRLGDLRGALITFGVELLAVVTFTAFAVAVAVVALALA